MKIRTDFVANSSSSSFVLARKGALNEKQKAAVIAYIEDRMWRYGQMPRCSWELIFGGWRGGFHD